MAGLSNPTKPVTEVGPDFTVRELLAEMLKVLQRIEFHLQMASDEELEDEDLDHGDH